MKVKLTNVRINIGGTERHLPELILEADVAELDLTFTRGRYGSLPLDEPCTLHVVADEAASILVEDMTPGNEEKGVSFVPLGTESNDDEPGLWAEIYGGRAREADAGTCTSGELFFALGNEKVAVSHDPNGMTVFETGY